MDEPIARERAPRGQRGHASARARAAGGAVEDSVQDAGRLQSTAPVEITTAFLGVRVGMRRRAMQQCDGRAKDLGVVRMDTASCCARQSSPSRCHALRRERGEVRARRRPPAHRTCHRRLCPPAPCPASALRYAHPNTRRTKALPNVTRFTLPSGRRPTLLSARPATRGRLRYRLRDRDHPASATP